ncbi:MAG: AraC family transcriptional regulator [Saccharofermentanales bacterium]
MLRGLKFHFNNEYISEPVQYGPILLWQVGDIGCDPGYVVKDHKQYCYELTCVVEGRGEIASDLQSYEIHKGQVYLNRPGEIHRITSDLREPIRYFFLGFDFNMKENTGLWSGIKKVFDQTNTVIVNDNVRISDYFSSLFDEMMTNDDISDEMIRYSIYQILLLFYRASALKETERYVPGGNMDVSRQLVYSILNYIDTNMFAIENLSDIAEQVGYSYYYISRLFSRVVGKSLRDYYQDKRFEKAADLLGKNIHAKEAAIILKYKSLNSFSKAFSSYYGMSPTDFQRVKTDKMNETGE